MTISELIHHVGDENIQYQHLQEAFVAAQMVKSGTHITFGTNAVTALEMATGNEKMIGMILWIPKDKWPTKSLPPTADLR